MSEISIYELLSNSTKKILNEDRFSYTKECIDKIILNSSDNYTIEEIDEKDGLRIIIKQNNKTHSFFHLLKK